jgi:hypothetical protein
VQQIAGGAGDGRDDGDGLPDRALSRLDLPAFGAPAMTISRPSRRVRRVRASQQFEPVGEVGEVAA